MTNNENQFFPYHTALVAAGILSVFIFGAVARAAEFPRGPDFPDELVHFEPVAKGVIFAGTGKDTWDRKIRERSYIPDGIDKGMQWRGVERGNEPC